MKKISLILSLLGLLILLLILFFSKPITINSLEDLTKLENNQKVALSGLIVEEKILGDNSILILESNIKLYCSSCKSTFKDKNIQAVGVINTFYGNNTLDVLKIKEIK